MIDETAAQSVASQRRSELQGAGTRQPPVPSSIVSRAQDVVQRQAGVVEGLRAIRDPVDGKEQRLEADQVRREGQEPRPFGKGLTDEPETELLQVPKSAVDQPG